MLLLCLSRCPHASAVYGVASVLQPALPTRHLRCWPRILLLGSVDATAHLSRAATFCLPKDCRLACGELRGAANRCIFVDCWSVNLAKVAPLSAVVSPAHDRCQLAVTWWDPHDVAELFELTVLAAAR